MEETNKTVEGEQVKGNPKEAKKETTDPYMNKTPVVGKARPRTPARAGTKSPSRPSSSPSRRLPSASSIKKVTGSRAKAAGNQNTLVSEIPDSTPKKMKSDVPEGDITIKSELKKEIKHAGHNIPAADDRANYVKSVAANGREGEQNTAMPLKTEKSGNSPEEDSPVRKGLKKLLKKSQKAEGKVDKLMLKYKSALKNKIKSKKIKVLHQKLIKAFTKLRRRHRKLRVAEAKNN